MTLIIYRFTVEVADFDFCASEETEYKTFFQQLRESIANSFKANIEPRNRDYKHRKSQTERPLVSSSNPKDYGSISKE